MSNFTRIVKTQVKFWKLHVLDVILWDLRFIFSGSHRKFSLVLLQMTNYIFSPWRCKKECNIRLFWYNVFVHWKLKLLSFLEDSVLNYVFAHSLHSSPRSPCFCSGMVIVCCFIKLLYYVILWSHLSATPGKFLFGKPTSLRTSGPRKNLSYF